MTSVEELLDGVRAVLFDFDGPICSVFAGYPAHMVANELRAYLTSVGMDASVSSLDTVDPLSVLQWASGACPDRVAELDDMLRAAERKAVRSAAPTLHAREAIVGVKSTGRVVAIVSNNSEPAIGDYLARHRLTSCVSYIAGRAHAAPHLMKPHPDSIERAVRHLAVPADTCAFVGDSATDVQVAQLTGVRPIGYAKTPAHRVDLLNAGATVMIDTMRQLVTALSATRP